MYKLYWNYFYNLVSFGFYRRWEQMVIFKRMIFTSSTKWTFIEDLTMNQPRYPLSVLMFCNHQNLKTTKCHIMWNFTCEFEFHLVRKKLSIILLNLEVEYYLYDKILRIVLKILLFCLTARKTNTLLWSLAVEIKVIYVSKTTWKNLDEIKLL